MESDKTRHLMKCNFLSVKMFEELTAAIITVQRTIKWARRIRTQVSLRRFPSGKTYTVAPWVRG